MGKKRTVASGGARRSQAEAHEIDDLERRIQELDAVAESNDGSGEAGALLTVLEGSSSSLYCICAFLKQHDCLQELGSFGILTTSPSHSIALMACVPPSTHVSRQFRGLLCPTRWQGKTSLAQPRPARARRWHF